MKRADSLLALSKRVIGERATLALARRTFFAHFCAGEDGASIQPTVQRLRAAGVGAILDYAAEEDVAAEPEAYVRTGERQGVVSARTYDYAGEAECDRNTDIFLQAITDAARGGGDGFVAVKLTALGKPVLLERMSQLLVAVRELWYNEFAQVGRDAITYEHFAATLVRLGIHQSDAQARALFAALDGTGDKQLDFLEWTYALRLAHLTAEGAAAAAQPAHAPIATSGRLQLLDSTEARLMRSLVGRLERIAAAAAAARVRLMIDAEQTYLQPAIDHFTLELQRRFNADFPAIFATYQCYLRRTRAKVTNDLERARRERFFFAGKLVRGAYLVLERARAAERGYESPVWDRIEQTHENYSACLRLILAQHARANVMVASHNQASVAEATALMRELGISRTGCVFFGQLLGMSDHLTLTLGAAGYAAYKYVPYGPVRYVLPYLVRRAQENSGMLSNVALELRLLRTELAQRLAPWRPARPQAAAASAGAK